MINKACYFYEYNESHHCLLKKQEIQFCDNPCKYFEVVSASPVFLNRMDALYRNSSAIQPEEGYEDIVMHSTPLYFVNKNADGRENIISPEEFADIIKAMYHDNVPDIRLIACSSGAFENGAAQILSDRLNVNIKAPIGPVVVDYFGNMYVEDAITQEEIYGESGWRIFKPRKENENGR